MGSVLKTDVENPNGKTAAGKTNIGDPAIGISSSGKKQTKRDVRVVKGSGKSGPGQKAQAAKAEGAADSNSPPAENPVVAKSLSTGISSTGISSTGISSIGATSISSVGSSSISQPVHPSMVGDPAFSPMRETLRDIVYTAKSYVGRNEMKSAAQTAPAIEMPTIPQAAVHDESLEMVLERDWRTYYSRRLTGHGLEIGPLHRPMVRHEGMVMDYIDRCTVKELREHYPELNDLPLVEPTILGDAETLANIKDKTFDFVIAAHVIEHMKNPLSALEQWCRVVKPRGKIYLIVPDKRITFDRNRVRTNIEHIIQDYRSPSAERDYDHFIDYAVHVQKKTGSDALVEAERLWKTDYSIHFHVFLPIDIIRLINWFSENIRPVKLVKGPSMSPGSDEFHLLLQVN